MNLPGLTGAIATNQPPQPTQHYSISKSFMQGDRRRVKTITNQPTASLTDDEWFAQGKADAWLGRPKQAPEHDPQAASLYDLGYDEGIIQRSPS